MGTLKDKNVLVTAGCQGIGFSICEHLLKAGANVATTYLTSSKGADALKIIASETGSKFTAIQADLTTRESCQRVVDEACSNIGSLHSVINNAGSLIERRGIEELDPDFMTRVLDLNLSSTVWITQAAVPVLAKQKEGSSIVNLASLAGRTGGHRGSIAYSTSKGAVITWTRHSSKELGDRGIRVNCVAPGLILGTSFHATFTSKESADKTIESLPLKRAGSPDDVARAVLFLASEYDGFISGITLDINGGVYVA
jgi:3-oxoacyl-[acyl-carrier protein] reductase